jgi:hypothetical protein
VLNDVGQLGAAQEHIEQAIHIRQQQRATDATPGADGRLLFEHELGSDEQLLADIEARQQRREKLRWAVNQVAREKAVSPSLPPSRASALLAAHEVAIVQAEAALAEHSEREASGQRRASSERLREASELAPAPADVTPPASGNAPASDEQTEDPPLRI